MDAGIQKKRFEMPENTQTFGKIRSGTGSPALTNGQYSQTCHGGVVRGDPTPRNPHIQCNRVTLLHHWEKIGPGGGGPVGPSSRANNTPEGRGNLTRGDFQVSSVPISHGGRWGPNQGKKPQKPPKSRTGRQREEISAQTPRVPEGLARKQNAQNKTSAQPRAMPSPRPSPPLPAPSSPKTETETQDQDPPRQSKGGGVEVQTGAWGGVVPPAAKPKSPSISKSGRRASKGPSLTGGQGTPVPLPTRTESGEGGDHISTKKSWSCIYFLVRNRLVRSCVLKVIRH